MDSNGNSLIAAFTLTLLLVIGTSWLAFSTSWLKARPKEILDSVLSKTAPEAASEELGGGSLTCERALNGVKIILTKGELF